MWCSWRRSLALHCRGRGPSRIANAVPPRPSRAGRQRCSRQLPRRRRTAEAITPLSQAITPLSQTCIPVTAGALSVVCSRPRGRGQCRGGGMGAAPRRRAALQLRRRPRPAGGGSDCRSVGAAAGGRHRAAAPQPRRRPRPRGPAPRAGAVSGRRLGGGSPPYHAAAPQPRRRPGPARGGGVEAAAGGLLASVATVLRASSQPRRRPRPRPAGGGSVGAATGGGSPPPAYCTAAQQPLRLRRPVPQAEAVSGRWPGGAAFHRTAPPPRSRVGSTPQPLRAACGVKSAAMDPQSSNLLRGGGRGSDLGVGSGGGGKRVA